MTEKNLKRLNRAELLEMLIAESKEVKKLEKENAELKRQLADRRIITEKVGSIAEASLLLNDVFKAAQAAADQYLDNVRVRAGVMDEAELIPETEGMTEE